MTTYRITNKDGTTEDHVFAGTIQQFVQKHWSGRGVPDGTRVSVAPEIPFSQPRFDPIEPELHPVVEAPKKVAPRKPVTRKKGD